MSDRSLMYVCGICGRSFEGRFSFQKYCSPECQAEAVRRQNRQYYDEGGGVARERRAAKSAATTALI